MGGDDARHGGEAVAEGAGAAVGARLSGRGLRVRMKDLKRAHRRKVRPRSEPGAVPSGGRRSPETAAALSVSRFRFDRQQLGKAAKRRNVNLDKLAERVRKAVSWRQTAFRRVTLCELAREAGLKPDRVRDLLRAEPEA